MKRSFLLIVLFGVFYSSCKKDDKVNPLPVSEIFLKDVVIASLPSPYYHFEYDASGHVSKVTFASGLILYEITHEGARIKEIKNMTNGDRQVYEYNNSERVNRVKIIKEGGTEYKRCFLSYDANSRLNEIEYELKAATGGFIAERTLNFSYHDDSNLKERKDHRYFIENRQTEATYTTHYEQYDDKINTASFMVLHEGYENLMLLPGPQMQKNNPLKEIRTGDGVNYRIDYTYTYDTNKCPVLRSGDMLMTNGEHAGQRFNLSSSFSYY